MATDFKSAFLSNVEAAVAFFFRIHNAGLMFLSKYQFEALLSITTSLAIKLKISGAYMRPEIFIFYAQFIIAPIFLHCDNFLFLVS